MIPKCLKHASCVRLKTFGAMYMPFADYRIQVHMFDPYLLDKLCQHNNYVDMQHINVNMKDNYVACKHTCSYVHNKRELQPVAHKLYVFCYNNIVSS